MAKVNEGSVPTAQESEQKHGEDMKNWRGQLDHSKEVDVVKKQRQSEQELLLDSKN